MDANVSIGSPGAASPSFQTSTLESGYFFLFDISSGTWEIKFKKGGYNESTETLVATATTITFNNQNVDYDNVGQRNGTGTVIVGYNLGDVEIAANALLVGAIKGVVHDVAAPFAALPEGTGLNIFYRRDLSDTSPISYIVRGVTTNAEGYIAVENLPAGYYGIGAITTFPQAVLNANGDIVGWTIAGGNVYVGVALQVTPGNTTLIPTGAR